MIKLFAGTSSAILAKKAADLADASIAKSEMVRFANSEIRVRIDEQVKDQVCVVIQSTSRPTDTNLIELLFYCDALKRSEAKKIVGIIPYFGYARQNIQHREGEDVSSHVVIQLLESVGFDEIITYDLHDEATGGVFSIPFKHLSALPLLAEHIKKALPSNEDVAIVSPDQGGIERAQAFADVYFGKKESPIGIIEKKRDLEKIHVSKALELFGDVKGKTVILVDDIVTSAGTILNATQVCLDQGATNVWAAVVHHDFSPEAPALIQGSKIEKFFTTDTVPLQKDQMFEKLQELSIALLLSQELKSLL